MAVKATLKNNGSKSTHRGEFAAVFAARHGEDGDVCIDERFSGRADIAIMHAFGIGIGRVIEEIDAANRLHGQAIRDGIEEALKTDDEGERKKARNVRD